MNLLPAVLIGGPPHAGKSVLAYSLSQALRTHDVQHYVLRAYPDGEGDWANEAPPELVRNIRVKGYGDPAWIDNICRDIARRHLPLIVDVGGQPTAWQEAVFEQCTHAILLTRNAAARGFWHGLMIKHGVTIIADLRSDLTGAAQLTAPSAPTLRGTITGLERHTVAADPVFEALVHRLRRLFYLDADRLWRHLKHTVSTEMFIDLPRLKHTLAIGGTDTRWEPSALPRVLEYIPTATSLALYGRAPNWLYAALVLHAHPAPVYQFDVRLGWVTPHIITQAEPGSAALLQVTTIAPPPELYWEFSLPQHYLDYAEIPALSVPPLPPHTGVIIGGKIPHWLLNSLMLTYRAAPWIGVYQPQLADRAVIIKSTHTDYPIGELLRVPAS